DREEVVEVVCHPASKLAEGIHPLDQPHLGVQPFVLVKRVAAPTVAPRVGQVLSVPAFAVLRRLGLILGVPGVPALDTSLHVDPLLGVPGVPALGIGFHVDLLLGVPGVAALGIGPLLGVAGLAAFGVDLLLVLARSLAALTVAPRGAQ